MQTKPTLPAGWQIVENHHLTKSFVCKSYWDGVELAVKVARLAEELNHHPDIQIGYQKITVTTWSHDINGLSERDYRLAEKIEQVR